MKVSPAFLIPLGVSALLGWIGGSAFRWVGAEQAWNLFTAAFLWTLISAAGTTIGRFAGERVRRGNWRRGLWLANTQTFPLTTVFLGSALIVGAPSGGSVVVILYLCTLVVAVAMSLLGVLSSPYR